MTNPFAPPTAVVADIALSQPDDRPTPFFAVSIVKLLILSICTAGFYEVYWFYKNWQSIKTNENSDLSPAPRAIFAVLYCYPCFARIRDFNSHAPEKPSIAAGPLATGWIITTLLYKLPDPFWFASLFAVVFLIPVQAHANKINLATNPNHDPNDQFSLWNWIAVGLGSIVLVLATIGTLMPHT